MSGVIKCDPVTMRNNLKAVEAMRLSCVDFVPVPISSTVTREQLVALMYAQFDQLEKDAK